MEIFHSHPSIFPSCHFFSPWLLSPTRSSRRLSSSRQQHAGAQGPPMAAKLPQRRCSLLSSPWARPLQASSGSPVPAASRARAPSPIAPLRLPWPSSSPTQRPLSHGKQPSSPWPWSATRSHVLLFDVLRSSPDVSARCRLAVLWSPVDSTPSTLAGCLLFLRSPKHRRRSPR